MWQCLATHADTISDQSLGELSLETAAYVQQTLLHAVEREAALPNPGTSEEHMAQVCFYL